MLFKIIILLNILTIAGTLSLLDRFFIKLHMFHVYLAVNSLLRGVRIYILLAERKNFIELFLAINYDNFIGASLY